MPRTLPTSIQRPPPTPASSASVAPEASFRDLPLDFFGSNGEISHYLRPSDFRRLIAADSRLFRLSREDEGLKSQFEFANKQFHQLLVHIVNADLNAAEAMIKEDRGLLLETGQVKDRGHLYEGTALTIALELGDISIYPEDHEEMADMICRHLKTLPNGEAEIARQIQAYFPNGFVEVTPYDFSEICSAIQNSPLADVQKALDNDPNNPPQKALCDALNKFRIEFAKYPRNVCHIAAAFTTYNNQRYHFKNWEHRALFCIRVIGFVQRYLPLCDFYTFEQGTYNIVVNRQRLTRDGFEFYDRGANDSNDTQKIKVFSWGGMHSGLGRDYLVLYSGAYSVRSGLRLGCWSIQFDEGGVICRAKTRCLANFIRAYVRQPASTPGSSREPPNSGPNRR